MNATVLNAESVMSPKLNERQAWCLKEMVNRNPSAVAVLPWQIPLDKVVAMGTEMGDLLVEFNAFGQVPAGSVRVRNGQEDMPTQIKRRMTADDVLNDAISIRRIRSKADAMESVEILRNEGSLHAERFLGAKKDLLREEIAKGKPLDCPSLFMGYAPQELHIANWNAAAMSWSRKSPEGAKTRLPGSIETAIELLFIEYRDEYRLTERADIQHALRNPRSPQLAERATALWGDEYVQMLESTPEKRRSAGLSRP